MRGKIELNFWGKNKSFLGEISHEKNRRLCWIEQMTHAGFGNRATISVDKNKGTDGMAHIGNWISIVVPVF